MSAPVTEMTGETSLMIRRVFEADIETLFRALTDPHTIMLWMGGGVAKPQRAESDLREGGAWFVEMQGSSGNPHNVKGAFTRVDPPNEVGFTWAWYSTPEAVSHVTYRLKAVSDSQTQLTLIHDRFATTDARDGHGRGWNASLDRLVDVLAA